MTLPYDLTTNTGKVRLLISDTDLDNLIFNDSEIAAFLALEGDNVRLAAAQALDTIASNEALVQKRIRLLDLSTDGPAVARSLRAHASELRRQVYDGLTSEEENGSSTNFDIGEMVVNDFSYRRKIYNEMLRSL